MSEYRDHTGKLIGFTRKSAQGSNDGVYDHSGSFLGSFDADSTRDQSGTRLGSDRNPSLLFDKNRTSKGDS